MAKYDVAIIGSGPGGYVAAIRAGELGFKTMVVEKDPYLGGTCLHVGCIPTKVLLHHADVYDHFKNGAELGFEVSGLKINWANILARKDKIVKKHAKGIEFLFKKNKVEWVQGWGRYAGPGHMSVDSNGKKSEIEAANILLVSGSEARALPGIEPDHKTILTNRSILELPDIPKTLIVVGAGSGGRGVCIHLQYVWDAGDDSGSAAAGRAGGRRRCFGGVGEGFQEEGYTDFHEQQGRVCEEGRQRRDGVFQGQGWEGADASGGKTLDGCRPEADDGELRTGEIEGEAGARICAHRAHIETEEKGLYAIGDIVAGMPQLAHAAMMEGIVAVTHIAGKKTQPILKTRFPMRHIASRRSGRSG